MTRQWQAKCSGLGSTKEEGLSLNSQLKAETQKVQSSWPGEEEGGTRSALGQGNAWAKTMSLREATAKM